VGEFQIVHAGVFSQWTDGQPTKIGGNVVSYFCTPDGRVIHAVGGPVSADGLLREAMWAVDLARAMADRSPKRQGQMVSLAHLARLNRQAPQPVDGGVLSTDNVRTAPSIHRLLARHPLTPLPEAYAHVFSLLGEEVSQAAIHYESARIALRRAKEMGRPILFLICAADGAADTHRRAWLGMLTANGKAKGDKEADREAAEALRDVTASCEVVLLSEPEMREVLSRNNLPGYRPPDGRRPCFLLTDAYGRQIDALTGWDCRDGLVRALARELLATVDARPLGGDDLVRLRQLAARGEAR
jgi:hypothetical protein